MSKEIQDYMNDFLAQTVGAKWMYVVRQRRSDSYSRDQ